MNTTADIVELKKQRKALAKAVKVAQSKPGYDSLELAGMKKRKLHLKEEIARHDAALGDAE